MNRLYIYPTSRAIRAAKAQFLETNALLPKMLTVADFESRAVVAGEYALVNKMQRKLFLKEASSFREIDPILKERSLVKFYTQADDFFNFFQEISAEGIAIRDLFLADTYAEFERDLALLERVLDNYRAILEQHKLTDRIFLPRSYKLNRNYIESFDSFFIELEGYLTRFELELFIAIAKIRPFIIKLRTTPFNQKLAESFRSLGIELDESSEIEFDLATKKILESKRIPLQISSEVIETQEPIEQIAVAIAKIEEMVQSGIAPQNIALIVPDESIVPLLRRFDRKRNFNFAMGLSFQEHQAYKCLDQIYRFLHGDKIAQKFLKHNGFDFAKLPGSSKMDSAAFFEYLSLLDIPLFSSESLVQELNSVQLLELYHNFLHTMDGREFSFQEWLFLWLYELKEHRLDDTHGGKVTVMGVLESRGMSFDGVVVLDFNDDKVPAISNKDRFLNSSVRAHAKLPTKSDRENLQKHYYTRLLERAKHSVLLYAKSGNLQASKFLYELGLHKRIKRYKTPHKLLFAQKGRYNAFSHMDDIEFRYDAKATVWSPSKLKTFLECRRKFYYRYVAKIEEAKSDTINDGQLLHTLLYRVIGTGKEYLDADELEQAIAKELGKIEYRDTLLLYKKPLWHNILRDFAKRQVEHFREGWRVEQCEFELKGEIGGLKFKGRIDRMDRKGDMRLVIDYKSGSISNANSKNVEKLDDFQMSIYSRLMGAPGNVDFAFIEIFEGGKMSYLKAPQEKDAKLLEHIEYLKSKKSFVAKRCEDLQKCRYCPYQLLCHRGEYL